MPSGREQISLLQQAKQQNVHIKNATVWTSAKAGKLENTDVLVEDGEFVKIGKNLSTPSGFTVIDATGMHLTAGIIDEHINLQMLHFIQQQLDRIRLIEINHKRQKSFCGNSFLKMMGEKSFSLYKCSFRAEP